MKKTIYSIALTIVLLVSTISVYANDTSTEVVYSNLEEMSNNEIDKACESIVKSVLGNDKSHMSKYVNCFTNEALTKIYTFVVNNEISGNIQSIVVDWIYPKYSSTSDSVMMLNAKIRQETYNNLYMFEFHINSEGKIYDYNVWAY